MCPYPSRKAWELGLLQGFLERTLSDVLYAPLQEMKLFLEFRQLFLQGQAFAQRSS